MAFGCGLEGFGFGADGGERHEEHGFVGEVGGGQGVEEGWQVGGDVGEGRDGKEAGDGLGGDLSRAAESESGWGGAERIGSRLHGFLFFSC